MQPDAIELDRFREASLQAAVAERLRVRDLLKQIACDLENPEPTIPTGLPKLDEFLDGGLRPGEVFVLAARPRVGKSAFALQVVLGMVSVNMPVAIWSLEMRPKQWIRRALAAMSGVPPKLLRRSERMSERDIASVVTAMEPLNKMPIHFAVGGSDPYSFAIEADHQVRIHGAKLLVIDYLQLMDPPPGGHSREQEVATMSRTIKRTANDLGVPVLLLCQLNRNAEGKVPQLSDLRESGAIEQDADEVFFLHRDMDPETHVLQNEGMGILAKNRDGEAGIVRLRYNWKAYMFEERA